MGLLDVNTSAPRDLHQAAEAMESLLLQQVLKASGAFKGSAGVAGSEMRAELFVGALADAVAKAGGLGIAGEIERQLASVTQPARHPNDDPPSPVGEQVPSPQRVHPERALKAYDRGVDRR